MNFSEDQIQRYSRHIILQEVGGVGQERLLNAKVLVIGAGGLGSSLIQYMSAAGVGTIGVVDDDIVDLTNLQRQVIHNTERIGWLKTESAKFAISLINPDIKVVTHSFRLEQTNALDLIKNYDIVADGSDNFSTRFLVNDACFFAKKTLVSAMILRFEGQLATFKVGDSCYRCFCGDTTNFLYNDIPSCGQAGVFGAMAGIVGSLQATEVLKEILKIGDSLSGNLLVIDALKMNIRKVRLKQDKECKLCGKNASIHDLSIHPVCQD
ncbi:MAG: molybdopterin-synthase adenylyltransferase MoeB [Rhodospirillaceae bacterium]|jgi:adenylyltransferase/sulfurtransferase|nr:molybdopterin-synthase adenylyltransferase MoeB [Rhodospirillaceae bacterium]